VTAWVLGWVARRIWPPAVIAAAVGVDHTARMAERTGDPLWDRLRVLIAVCALFAGIVAALTPRSTT
jgi:hypothetical protein